MSKPLVLVTGGTGFVGSHVVFQLLQQGYHVRAAVRNAPKLRAIFPDAVTLEKLEVVEVPSLTSDYTEALKGIGAVVHVASPLFSKGATGEEIINGAYRGTLQIAQQAIAAGVRKIIITGTFASLFECDFKAAFGNETRTEKHFCSVALEDIDPKQDPMVVYQQAKSIADKKTWEIAREHLDVDLTVILPPAVYGPLVPNYPLTDSPSCMGTNRMLYQLLTAGPNAYPPILVGHMVDVRDLARAHIAALTAPPIPGRDKRFIVAYGTYTLKNVAELVRKERPEMAGRLPRQDVVPPAQTSVPLDMTFTKEVLGMEEYVPWEETVLAAVDVAKEWERKNGIGR